MVYTCAWLRGLQGGNGAALGCEGLGNGVQGGGAWVSCGFGPAATWAVWGEGPGAALPDPMGKEPGTESWVPSHAVPRCRQPGSGVGAVAPTPPGQHRRGFVLGAVPAPSVPCFSAACSLEQWPEAGRRQRVSSEPAPRGAGTERPCPACWALPPGGALSSAVPRLCGTRDARTAPRAPSWGLASPQGVRMGWGWGTPRQAARARDFCTLILGGGQTGSSCLPGAGAGPAGEGLSILARARPWCSRAAQDGSVLAGER